jgi:hypothetical protein
VGEPRSAQRRAPLEPSRAYAVAHELELDAQGQLVPTTVVFLTNRECPFSCVYCDLWMNTLEESLPPGLIPQQIRAALAPTPHVPRPTPQHIKLYNAGSFFDPQAIPPEDDREIAALVRDFDRVIVEAHPAFLRGVYAERCLALRDQVHRLEVAIGLETAHAGVLAQLNKKMTVDDFRAAVGFLRAHDIDARAFILLQPPFMAPADAVAWACRSIDVAFDAGCSVCCVIPTRGVSPAPTVDMLETVIEYGIALGRGRVFADLWDLDPARVGRLRAMNETQRRDRH